ncbi:NRDE family protein [Zhongshania sp.]|uniref:NRDE family protein n=1 Tax=Zhongshania sp. TaxID=1971902 RepID=UPI00356973A1
MCLILLSWQQLPDRPLIIAANRDEFYARPTLPAGFWPEHPEILAGRDLEFGGSWLGLSRNGRFAAVTNLREIEHTGELSRGDLVKNFLLSDNTAPEYLSQLETEKRNYRPFNFIGFDGETLGYSNNSDTGWQRLAPGRHAIGNIPLSSSNEKTIKGKQDMDAALYAGVDHLKLFEMLKEEEPSGQHDDAYYRALSSRFVNIVGADYGTRSSSVLQRHADGSWDFWEQLYNTEPADPNFLTVKMLNHFQV